MRYRDYDKFAPIYNQYWGNYSERFLPVLDNLALKDYPPPAPILDLCCGTGQLAVLLHKVGYQVTGLDGSEDMLQYAQERAPDCQFINDDARTFSLPPEFAVVVSVYDSLNHIMTITELTQVFSKVYAALKPGGTFVFDVNMESGYARLGDGSFGNVQDDQAFIVRYSWDAEEKRSCFQLTAFRLENGSWQRSDFSLWQTCYTEEEIRGRLELVGFTGVECHDALEVGMQHKPGDRAFFLAHKEAES
jgi:SAM-dependent methyltransferase